MNARTLFLIASLSASTGLTQALSERESELARAMAANTDGRNNEKVRALLKAVQGHEGQASPRVLIAQAVYRSAALGAQPAGPGDLLTLGNAKETSAILATFRNVHRLGGTSHVGAAYAARLLDQQIAKSGEHRDLLRQLREETVNGVCEDLSCSHSEFEATQTIDSQLRTGPPQWADHVVESARGSKSPRGEGVHVLSIEPTATGTLRRSVFIGNPITSPRPGPVGREFVSVSGKQAQLVITLILNQRETIAKTEVLGVDLQEGDGKVRPVVTVGVRLQPTHTIAKQSLLAPRETFNAYGARRFTSSWDQHRVTVMVPADTPWIDLDDTQVILVPLGDSPVSVVTVRDPKKRTTFSTSTSESRYDIATHNLASLELATSSPPAVRSAMAQLRRARPSARAGRTQDRWIEVASIQTGRYRTQRYLESESGPSLAGEEKVAEEAYADYVQRAHELRQKLAEERQAAEDETTSKGAADALTGGR